MVSRTKSLNRSAHPEKRFVSRATTKEPEPPSVDGLRHVDHPRLAGEAGSRRSPWHAVVQLEPNAASARQGLLVYVDPQTENPSATNGAGWSSPTLLSFDVARVLSANHDRPGAVLQCRVSATADSGSPNPTDRPQPKADVLRRWSPIQRHHGPRLPMFQRVFLWHCQLTAASSRIPSRDLPAENSNTPAPSQSSTARRP